jgi:acyl-CoA synthetase
MRWFVFCLPAGPASPLAWGPKAACWRGEHARPAEKESVMSLGMKINQQRRREYRRKGYWGDATLKDYWDMSVLSMPDKLAVTDRMGTRMSYTELNDAAGRLAMWLHEVGVKPGDMVSVQLPGWTEFTVIYGACLKVGAVINPILPNHRAKEVSFILKKCQSKVLFIPSCFRNYDYPPMIQEIIGSIPTLEQVVVVEKETEVQDCCTLNSILRLHDPLPERSPRGGDDLAAVLFTSGTESVPKGVMHTHNTIIASIRPFTKVLHLTDRDIMLMPAPVAHATGFHHGVTTPIMLGATHVLHDIFKPETALATIERERCTYSMGATPIIHDMLCELQRKPYDISSLRFVLCGGAPSPRHVLKDAWDAGFRVISVYGSTESVPHTVSSPEAPLRKIHSTDGQAVPSVEVRVVDAGHAPVPACMEGEEASRGPNVFVGYLREPELTDKVLDDEGWYYSGDLCVMDKQGYVKITGRKKDVIIRGGENISSNEVEGILLRHPKVKDTAVVAMPDPRLGERTCAYVVLEDDADDLSLEDVIAFFKEKHVAKYKYPERIETINCIPRNPSGKVQKFALRDDIRTKLEGVMRCAMVGN